LDVRAEAPRPAHRARLRSGDTDDVAGHERLLALAHRIERPAPRGAALAARAHRLGAWRETRAEDDSAAARCCAGGELQRVREPADGGRRAAHLRGADD